MTKQRIMVAAGARAVVLVALLPERTRDRRAEGRAVEFLVFIGLMWLIGAIFGKKAPKHRPVNPRVAEEARANAAESQADFDEAFKQWSDRALAFAGQGRWIPKGTASRFLASHPAPQHRAKTWKQAVGDSSPEETLRLRYAKFNGQHMVFERIACGRFFNTVERNPLTEEQIHACICMDDAVMVVAAAGSGKTSTMVAKTGYALHRGLAKPDQILLLAFNKATAEEVGVRIAEQLKEVPQVERVRSSTFHAFGIDVIAKATGKKPSLAPWVDPGNPGADVREVGDIIQMLCDQDKAFKRDWDLFRTVYARDVGKWGQPDEPEAYGNGVRGFRTARGEVVKSKEERTISDWLFYNGVKYEYERPYEHDTADHQFRQYFPDFYYPDIQLYHEHFALNGRGEAPKQFKDYLAGVKWKRELHAKLGTALFETTSHGLLTGEAIPALATALQARGVHLVFEPEKEGTGLSPVQAQDLARSFRVFQQHVKNNGLDRLDLHAALAAQSQDGFGARLRMYLKIYEQIAQEWERRLQRGNFIDFEDMLILASEHVESGAYRSPFVLILADEFQDSSRARIRLLKALSNQSEPPAHLCVVGDDWQGINRFAGSDITVMTEFEKTFNHATRLSLSTTFRCPQDVCDISSQFIQANPAQIKKKVKTTNTLTKTPILAYGFSDQASIVGHVEKQLAHMHQLAISGKLLPLKGPCITVMLLGRYRDDRPGAIEVWQRRFGDKLSIEYRTVHGSKGLEAEYVFVLNVVEGTRGFPSQIQDDPALQLAMPAPDPFPVAEERRLFYVAMTRARKQVRLYTTLAQPSRFLVELVKQEHLKIEPVDGDALEPCPGCGRGVLQLRSGPYGDFHGCSRFPACTFKRKVSQESLPPVPFKPNAQRLSTSTNVGDPCPVCKQGMLQSRSGRNGPFLGCSRFQHGCKATRSLGG
ncbi:UvrD-helicase domain-containing protein [Stenotrophomonas geniculata]|uniref:UvrD-helicase domain-containing protein n=1 Tax=Stenotrophomonas geniculata TaxID=86188 RepID=UPI00287F49E4|nr:UvrD-helicase domain-containing protein [Stenotrophomonas geniculata]WNF11721.1 UvrD-helicase domain-containing protein [Stenotrophomonas geniculata]